MTGMTDYSAQHFLDWVDGKTAMPSLPTAYAALFTAVGTDAGSGFTEVTGGSYARVALAGLMNSGAGSAPSNTSNASSITFPMVTVTWGNVLAWGLYDAASSGNLLCWDFLGNDPWFPCSITSASPGVVTAPGITAGSAPGLANGATVVFSAEYGGALPAALTQYTQYTVAGLSADTFNVGVNTAAISGCMVRQVTVQNIPINVTPQFAGGTPGALVLLAA
jgi:hypothetical protein